MNAYSHIRIEQDENHPHVHRIYQDDTQLMRVRAIDTHIEVGEVPIVTVDFVAGTSFDEMAQLECVLHPESITECVKGIQFEMRMDDEFRQAVKGSILSAITDSDWESADGLADAILERVFLGER